MNGKIEVFRHCLTTGDNWFRTKSGNRFKLLLLSGTVAAYPVAIILCNGPLLKITFPRRHFIDYNLPEHIKKIINEQYEKFLEHEGRPSRDAVINFSMQRSTESLDSLSAGSMGVRFGAQIALPFFASFRNEDEALEYCKKHLEPFYYIGKIPICLIWDSTVGRELIQTMILTENELKFLIARDIYGNDGYNAFINKPISWASWTTFASIFTYWIHKRFTKNTILPFLLFYLLFNMITIYGCYEWHYLYKHMNFCHSDNQSAHLSMEHSQGGKQYYYRFLKRNRIIRNLLEKQGDRYISAVGDERKAITPYLIRYELLKDIGVEDDQIRLVMEGDVL